MQKAADLHRTVWLRMSFRCSRWLPSASRLAHLNAIHRTMLAILTRLPRIPGEAVDVYCRRRNRHVSGLINRTWGQDWCSRVIDLQAHVSRRVENPAWGAGLLAWRGDMWLQERRIGAGSASATAGRISGRASRGRACIRWHEGVHFAETHFPTR